MQGQAWKRKPRGGYKQLQKMQRAAVYLRGEFYLSAWPRMRHLRQTWPAPGPWRQIWSDLARFGQDLARCGQILFEFVGFGQE